MISNINKLNILKYDDIKKGLNAYKLIQKYDSKYQAIKIKKVYDWMLGIGTKPDFIF